MTNWPWSPLPVQWLARFGIYRSHPRAARRRSSAAGCSPPRRCPKPEFGSFEGGLGLFCESLNGEQSPRGGSSDTTWIWTEWGFLGCWTLMCWEGWRGRRVVIPKLSVPSFGLALPALCHTHLKLCTANISLLETSLIVQQNTGKKYMCLHHLVTKTESRTEKNEYVSTPRQ